MSIVKPATQSKTLTFNKLAGIVAAIFAAAPSVISFIVDMLGDDAIAAAVADFIPVQYRALLFLVVAYMARQNFQLRKATTTPIQGTPAAEQHVAELARLGVPEEVITTAAGNGGSDLQQFLTGDGAKRKE